jgi:hypothetical protein
MNMKSFGTKSVGGCASGTRTAEGGGVVWFVQSIPASILYFREDVLDGTAEEKRGFKILSV